MTISRLVIAEHVETQVHGNAQTVSRWCGVRERTKNHTILNSPTHENLRITTSDYIQIPLLRNVRVLAFLHRCYTHISHKTSALSSSFSALYVSCPCCYLYSNQTL